MVTEGKEDLSKTMVLVISLNLETNNISIQGPINDKVLAYGMLEFARDAIFEHHKKLEKTAIIPVNGNGIMNFVRGKK